MKLRLTILLAFAIAIAAANASTAQPATSTLPAGHCLDMTNGQKAANGKMVYPHPLGWPCLPFTNRARVAQRVQQILIYNGFRPNITFYAPSKRQITFKGYQDGERIIGVVVKTAARQIYIALWNGYSDSLPRNRFNLGFIA